MYVFQPGPYHQVDGPPDGHQDRHQLQHDQRAEVGGADQALQEAISGDGQTHLRPQAVSAAKRSQRGDPSTVFFRR